VGATPHYRDAPAAKDDGRDTYKDKDGTLHRVARTRYAYVGRHRTMAEAAFARLIDEPEFKGDAMRLALLLMLEAERNTMIIKMTRAAMAERLGVLPTNVSRLMKKLIEAGLVIQDGAVRRINPTWAFGADSRAHAEAVKGHYLAGGVGVNDRPKSRLTSKPKSTTTAPKKPRRLTAVPNPPDGDMVPGQMNVYDAGA
jgi:hypothetical protein